MNKNDKNNYSIYVTYMIFIVLLLIIFFNQPPETQEAIFKRIKSAFKLNNLYTG